LATFPVGFRLIGFLEDRPLNVDGDVLAVIEHSPSDNVSPGLRSLSLQVQLKVVDVECDRFYKKTVPVRVGNEVLADDVILCPVTCPDEQQAQRVLLFLEYPA
jgi:hypothetical protein